MGALTNQQIFDRVVQAMVKQGHKSASLTDSECFYLSPEGDRCGVGCLFKTDEETNKKAADLRGPANRVYLKTAADQPVMRTKIESFLDFDLQEGQMLLLMSLQRAHDGSSNHSSSFVNDFLVGASNVAQQYHLKNTAATAGQPATGDRDGEAK